MKILTGFLILVMMFTISFVDTQAITQYTGGIQGVELFYSGGTSTNDDEWNYTITNLGYDEGWIVFAYPGSQQLSDQGTMPEGDYDFSSVNEDYQYLMIGNVLLNIYEYDYVFELEYDSTEWRILPNTTSTTDPGWTSSIAIPIGVLDNSDIRLLDGSQDVSEAYTSGYLQGRDDYAYVDGDTYYTATQWGTQQYNEALSQGEANALAIQNMIPGLLGVIFAFFFQLASISVLGVTALDLIAALFGLGVVLVVLKAVIK